MATLKSIAQGIQPTWTLNKWFQWPPNVFALMSIVLQRTGCYKICLINNPWWEENNWHDKVAKDAKIWLKASNKGIQHEEMNFKLSGYTVLKENYQIIKKDWNRDEKNRIDLNRLRTLKDYYDENTAFEDIKLKEYAIALVSLLSIADSCCSGLGLISQSIASDPKDSNLFKSVANLLLTTTGSLSSISKFHGTVLPKMRTPQSGIVLRSMSHHLTFHSTEVEVVWRTFPWLNDDKKSLNLLIVPYPNKIHKTDFKIVEENYHSVRYFKGKIQEHLDIDFFDGLVNEIYKRASTNNEVDLLIFPEMALSEKQYNYLLNKLTESYTFFSHDDLDDTNGKTFCLQLPIIISGVLHENESSALMNPVHNEVRMAVFFAGKWYDITQRKHHRWQLDRNQLLQYGLEGYFPTDRKWFELCSILQRRLTILAPNSWLALTALICEDLARQEPVTEVIRGIGPSLLMALLSDGPQTYTRWSARYASVLADDPGTAVLSITSRGMAIRSRRPGDKKKFHNEESLVVGLWKDMIRGQNELQIEHDKLALMFTISAKFEKEYTLDGRSDGVSSSVFKMDSLQPKQVIWKYDGTKKSKEMEGLSAEKQIKIDKMTKSDEFGNWHNIRMLSALSYTVDSIVDLLTQNVDKEILENSKNIILQLWTSDKTPPENGDNLFKKIKNNISESWDEPINSGTAAIKKDNSSQTNNMTLGTNTINQIVKKIQSERTKTSQKIFSIIVKVCEDFIINNQDKKASIPKAVAMTFLYNINTKLLSCKTPKQLNPGINSSSGLTPKEAMDVMIKIKEIIQKSMLP